jgi:hypothetical protein
VRRDESGTGGVEQTEQSNDRNQLGAIGLIVAKPRRFGSDVAVDPCENLPADAINSAEAGRVLESNPLEVYQEGLGELGSCGPGSADRVTDTHDLTNVGAPSLQQLLVTHPAKSCLANRRRAITCRRLRLDARDLPTFPLPARTGGAR